MNPAAHENARGENWRCADGDGRYPLFYLTDRFALSMMLDVPRCNPKGCGRKGRFVLSLPQRRRVSL